MRNKAFIVELTPQERAKLDQLAKESGRPRGHVVRFLIEHAQIVRGADVVIEQAKTTATV